MVGLSSTTRMRVDIGPARRGPKRRGGGKHSTRAAP
jgi:hypothetical protein